jgi:hypothetical protein
LLVDVVEQLAATVVLVVEFLATQPVGVVDVVVVVEGVEAYIFGEVRQRLFRVEVQVVPGVVSIDGVAVETTVFVLVLLSLLSVVLLFVPVSLLDDFVVVEVVRIDFIDWGKDNSIGVRTMDDGNREGVQVDSFVDVLTGPNCSIVEGLVVFGVVEQSVQSYSLLELFLVEDRKDLAPWEQPVLIDLIVVLCYLRIRVVVVVLADVIALRYFDLVLVVRWLVDVSEQAKNVSLPLQELFISDLLLGVGPGQSAKPCKQCNHCEPHDGRNSCV